MSKSVVYLLQQTTRINKITMRNQTETPSNTTLISQEVFNELMKNLKCETGNDIETIGFSSKFKSYEISFHGFLEYDYNVVVEDFGRMVSGKWIQMEPKDNQLYHMFFEISHKITELRIERLKELNKQSDAINREIEIARYGREGAIYSNDY